MVAAAEKILNRKSGGLGSLIGATQATEAVEGENFLTGRALTGLDRWGMAFQGISAASGVAALGLGIAGIDSPLDFSGWFRTAAEESTADTVVRFGPHMERPLPESISSTFRGGRYSQTTLGSDTTLYRVYGGGSKPMASWWSRTAPSGPPQSQIDLPLPPENTAQSVIVIRVPEGTVIYEGSAEGNFGRLGGGNQIYIPKVNLAWVVRP